MIVGYSLKAYSESYKWQINSGCGANVIKGNQEDFVEGIVFTVSPSDVQALRHYEGVKQQFYAERKLDIEVERIPGRALEGVKPADAAEILALYNSESRLTESNSSADATTSEQNDTKSNSNTSANFSRELNHVTSEWPGAKVQVFS